MGTQEDAVPSNELRAEAADWVARLRDEQRGPGLEAEFQAWLDESNEHRRAFNRMTQVWERAGQIRMRARDEVAAVHKERRSRFIPWGAALAATLLLAVITAFYYWHISALVRPALMSPARHALLPATTTQANTKIRATNHAALECGDINLDLTGLATRKMMAPASGGHQRDQDVTCRRR